MVHVGVHVVDETCRRLIFLCEMILKIERIIVALSHVGKVITPGNVENNTHEQSTS